MHSSIKLGDIFSFDFALGCNLGIPNSQYLIKIIHRNMSGEYLVECINNNSPFVVGYRNRETNEEGAGISCDSVLNTKLTLMSLNKELLSTQYNKGKLLDMLKVPVGFRYYMSEDKLKFFSHHRKNIFIDLEERLSVLDI